MKMATRKEIKDMYRKTIYKFILQVPSSSSTIYKKITKVINEKILEINDLDYMMFSLQNTYDLISESFYITKAMELSIFPRLYYILKIIDTRFDEDIILYNKEKK